VGRRDFVTALVLFALALAYFSLTARRTLDLRDEGYLMSRTVETAAGAVPRRDFSDVYGPGVFALTGAALLLGGGEIVAVRALVAVFKALAVVFGFLIARTFAPPWAAIGSALLGIAYWGRLAANLNTPYGALFTLPLAAAALWSLIRATQSGSPRGFLAAGLIAGVTILFKQSLGLMLAYGMALSIVAVAMCRVARPARRDGPARPASARAALALFLVAGALPLVPAFPYLSARDYAVHFLPFQALVLGVSFVAWRRGGPPLLGAAMRRELAPFALGALAAPLLTVGLYAIWGSTGALFRDMFALPMSLENYYTAVALPPLSLAVSFLGMLLLATALLCALGARLRLAGGLSLVGALVLAAGRFGVATDLPRLYTREILVWRAPFALEGVLLPGLSILGMALAVAMARRREAAPLPLAALLPLFFTQALLCFEVFPRAGHNLWILHGALAPLFAWVLYAGVALAVPRDGHPAVRLRRAAAVAVAVLVPLWLVGPIVRTVLRPVEANRRAPALPRAHGLSLGLRQIIDLHIDDLERLVRFLDRAEPPDAPLLVLTNEAVVPLFSGRRNLFEHRAYALFLAGWGMLPRDQRLALDSARTLDVLRRTPDLLVVHQQDATARNLRRALPGIREYVEANFEVVARFGVYRVLRRAGRATLRAESVSHG